MNWLILWWAKFMIVFLCPPAACIAIAATSSGRTKALARIPPAWGSAMNPLLKSKTTLGWFAVNAPHSATASRSLSTKSTATASSSSCRNCRQGASGSRRAAFRISFITARWFIGGRATILTCGMRLVRSCKRSRWSVGRLSPTTITRSKSVSVWALRAGNVIVSKQRNRSSNRSGW